MRISKKNKYNLNNVGVLDLFCGAGGFSEGFVQEGYDVLLGIDNDKHCISTYNKNFQNRGCIRDIRSVDAEFIAGHIRGSINSIDIIIGGPPCQGFSTANRQKLIDDPRNELYKQFVRLVDCIRPVVVVMENVRGIIKKASDIQNDFINIKYELSYLMINAKNYGIPQNRERIFFIGVDKNKLGIASSDMIIKWIKKQEKLDKPVQFGDSLWGLRMVRAKNIIYNTNYENKYVGFTKDKIIKRGTVPEYIIRINRGKIPTKVYNHKTRYNNERDIEIFKRLPQGGQSDDPSISDIMPYSSRNHIFRDKYYKLIWNKPCKTITAHMKNDCNMYIHPIQARGLTPREAARVQSFPDDFQFLGPYTSWYRQIGNAVPPHISILIARGIKTIVFDGDLKK